MREALKVILKIQELDIKMIRLMGVKRERQKELEKLLLLKADVQTQVTTKEQEILELKKRIRLGETQVKEIQEKVARLEASQAAVKKMDEFNALTQELAASGKEKNLLEAKLSDLMDILNAEEERLVALQANLKKAHDEVETIEKEIHESVSQINGEGTELLKEREALIKVTSSEMFKIYERLIKNKKDRVIVPIENRTCSGCHILLTPQHENLVRKGDRLVFCEHCSRVLYWQEMEVAAPGEESTTRRRRRKASTT